MWRPARRNQWPAATKGGSGGTVAGARWCGRCALQTAHGPGQVCALAGPGTCALRPRHLSPAWASPPLPPRWGGEKGVLVFRLLALVNVLHLPNSRYATPGKPGGVEKWKRYRRGRRYPGANNKIPVANVTELQDSCCKCALMGLHCRKPVYRRIATKRRPSGREPYEREERHHEQTEV